MKELTVEDLIDLALTLTVCFGIIVMLIVVFVFALTKPALATEFVGTITVKKGAGLGAVLFFFYLVLRLVYGRRRKNGK